MEIDGVMVVRPLVVMIAYATHDVLASWRAAILTHLLGVGLVGSGPPQPPSRA